MEWYVGYRIDDKGYSTKLLPHRPKSKEDWEGISWACGPFDTEADAEDWVCFLGKVVCND